MDLALYHPEHGFYAGGGQAGRRGDFVTSPEVGPLFGAVLARALDEWWDDMGRPDPYVVVEAGAGAGMLARTVLGASPRCLPALRYLMVERSASLRARQGQYLDLTIPSLAMGPIQTDEDGLSVPGEHGVGPIVSGLSELPSVEGPVIVVANELLDNLAFSVIERVEGGWNEVRVGLDAIGHELVEQPVPAPPGLVPSAVAEGGPVGGRVPVQHQAARWLRDALDLAAPGGRVVVFDYTATSAELLARPWPDWLRTYAGHSRAGSPLERLGDQDITADVCVDQLERVRPCTGRMTQRDWLARYGVGALVEDGRRVWTERAHIGDLEALRARSRIGEAEAISDPAGLGGFTVMEWHL